MLRCGLGGASGRRSRISLPSTMLFRTHFEQTKATNLCFDRKLPYLVKCISESESMPEPVLAGTLPAEPRHCQNPVLKHNLSFLARVLAFLTYPGLITAQDYHIWANYYVCLMPRRLVQHLWHRVCIFSARYLLRQARYPCLDTHWVWVSALEYHGYLWKCIAY